MRDVGPLFQLLFDDEFGCGCGNELWEGDQAAYIDGELSCVDCWDEERTCRTNISVKGDNITLGKEE